MYLSDTGIFQNLNCKRSDLDFPNQANKTPFVNVVHCPIEANMTIIKLTLSTAKFFLITLYFDNTDVPSFLVHHMST